jgi:prepilin-type N-terminal cleavage/methylation domain-containing protein/prepilin-type processing-associated H-X9-DG protein
MNIVLCKTSSSKGGAGSAFTLIELLVVIAAIGILAALLLPALRGAKDRVLVTKCLSNLREIGLAVQLYRDDNEGRYPTVSGANWISFRLGGDDPDAGSGSRFGLENATNRVLWQYTTSRDLYRCPADRGMNVLPFMQPFDNLYAKIGTSYKYNDGPLCPTREVDNLGSDGIAGNLETCIREPSRRILVHEPPASPWNWGEGWYYTFWHYARGPNTVFSLSQAKDRFISPVLFADGHAAAHDFTANIRANPWYPCEPTADWYWYEAAR